MRFIGVVIQALITLCIVCLCGAIAVFGVVLLADLRHEFNPLLLLLGVFFTVTPLLLCGFGIELVWNWDY